MSTIDSFSQDWIVPDWPAPVQVRALSTTRCGGVSSAPYTDLNLGLHVEDDESRVMENRRRLVSHGHLPSEPIWLRQVHGIDLAKVSSTPPEKTLTADGAITSEAGVVCAVLTADCLPVLFCNQDGSKVAAVHAGWRGLCEGILEQTVAEFGQGEGLMVWLGPAIGPQRFEVGSDVRAAFLEQDAQAASAFVENEQTPGKWFADLYQLARQRLHRCDVTAIFGGQYCTHSQAERFFSYRRDGVTGRMATLIWIES